ATLALLDRIGSTDGETVESWVLRGQLAADRGAYGEADRDLRRADSLEPPDADWRWDIARIRAELAELRGGVFNDLVAELHYRRSIAMVAALRTTARAHDAFFVASHRAP